MGVPVHQRGEPGPDADTGRQGFVRIAPADARPLYLQIVDEMRRAVAVGDLAANEALPSVRQLAGELRINPNTVQQAYRELERAGVVYVRRGQGTYVADGGMAEVERRSLLDEVATRALRDAHRHGCTAEELIAALRARAAEALASREGESGVVRKARTR